MVPLALYHLPQVLAIEQVSFPVPWTPRIFQAELRHPRALPLAALLEPTQVLAGYLCLWLVAEEAQVQNLAVHPAFRGRGVGRRLLWEGLRRCRDKGAHTANLEVRPSNLAAQALYRSLGFTQVGRRPGYYQPEGEDALILQCDLDQLFAPGPGGRGGS